MLSFILDEQRTLSSSEKCTLEPDYIEMKNVSPFPLCFLGTFLLTFPCSIKVVCSQVSLQETIQGL